MIPINHKESIWRFEDSVFNFMLPADIACWLFDAASLTARLTAACDGKFSVRVVSQRWGSPLQNELKRLGMRPRNVALIREVFLLCNNEPWVFARTVIPRATLSGKQKYLANIGTRPLGAVLFADPNMQRDHFEVACIRPGEMLFQHAKAGMTDLPDHIWGRRSAFYLSKKPLLVNEIFLPAIAKCAKLPTRK